MKRTLIALFSSCLLLVTAGSWAQGPNSRLRCAVDPATATPVATVVQNSEGVTVVLFRVPFINAGDVFSFRLDLTSRSTRMTYPMTVGMQDRGNGKLDAAFDPPAVLLTEPNLAASALVTVTVGQSGEGAKKIKIHIKPDAARGSHLGNGPGVKVVIMQGSATSARPEEQMLLDIQDALSPDGEAGSEYPYE
jgi:hypothetical protein